MELFIGIIIGIAIGFFAVLLYSIVAAGKGNK